jgi:hypothetical protein
VTAERGITLLELVVGLTIAGLAVSGGYAALSAYTDQSDRARRVTEEITVAAAKRRMLVRILEGARAAAAAGGPIFRGLDRTHRDAQGEVPDDELSFLTSSPTELSAGRSVVRLYVDRDSLTPERGLMLEIARPEGHELRRIELVPDARGLDCRYLTRMLGRAEWLPSWISGTVLPLGVELTVLPPAPERLPLLLAWPITAALEPAR